MPFSSSWAKLARAEEHRKVIEPEIKAFVESKPVEFASQHNLKDPQGPIRFIYSVSSLVVPPAHWALVAGDAIQNIRAALDHAVWTLVVKEKGTEFAETNAPKIDFPIVDKAASFPTARLVKIGLSNALIALIEQAQPYIRQQNTPRDNPLWLIRALSNVDKHRLLHVIAMVPEKTEIKTTPFLADGNIEFLTPGALYKGAKIVRFTAARPAAYTKVEVTANFEVGVCIDATTESRAIGIDLALRSMRERAVGIVNTLAAHASPRSRRQRR